MPSLFVIQGRDQGQRFDITGQVAVIGRDVESEIRLFDTEVSRSHAAVEFDDESSVYVVVDNDSSNGTFVNGERIDRQTLRNGDRLLVGSTLLIFTGHSDDETDVLGDIDIVAPNAPSESRIITSIADSGAENDGQWLARARSNLQVMYRTALAVSHTMDIDELLGRIMELIFEWVEADRGCIMLVNQETRQLKPKVRRNRPGIEGESKMSISRTILDYVMQKREGVLTSDAKDDDRWNAAASIVKLGVREAICVPMQGRYGIVGIIYIDTYTSPGKLLERGSANKFNEEHLKLMIAIGHQAALAIEDTSYYSAMVQAERMAAIGQTIAGLSHHVKNILQGIRGGSYLIEEGLKGDDHDVLRKGWRIVEKNQERISRLVLDMLTFSKEREPELIEANLNQVVGDVVELVQVRADESDTTLQWTPMEELPRVKFDPEAIHHALLNIVSNAIDACQQAEGLVSIDAALSSDRRRVCVAVQDNGIGMNEEELAQIFNLFVSKKGSRGTGLGLTVSRKIVREHGGDITVTSNPGQGSQFVLELPIEELEDDSSSISATSVIESDYN